MQFPKLLIVLGVMAIATSYTEKKHVLILTPNDFPDVIAQFPRLFIQFYSTQCEISKKLTPVFNQIAKEFNISGIPIRFANINAQEYAIVRAAHEIKEYPTLIYFNKGQSIRYKGERTKAALISWLKKKLNPPVINIDPSSIQELRSNGKVNILFNGEIQTHQHGTLFQKLALADQFNLYYSVEGTALPQGTVQMFRPFDEPINIIIDKNLRLWITQHQRPVVVPFDARTIESIFVAKNTTVVLFQQPNSLNAGFTQAARKVRLQLGKPIIFVRIEHQTDHHKTLAQNIKVVTEKSPIVIIDGTKGNKYVLVLSGNEITDQKIVQFVMGWQQGKLKKYGIEEQVLYAKKAKGDDEL